MRFSQRIRTYQVSAEDSAQLRVLLEKLSRKIYSQASVFDDIDRVTCELPRGLRQDLHDFRSRENDLVMRMVGLPQGRIKELATPAQHGDSKHDLVEDHVLYLAILNTIGYSVGFSTQQSGRVVNDIMPMRRSAAIHNSSNGSDSRFGFHTEDAFHRTPPPLFSLYCVRNPTGPGITLSAVDSDTIPAGVERELRRPAYRVEPNPSQAGWRACFDDEYSILSGDRRNPYLRINSAETHPSHSGDAAKRRALAFLNDHLAANSVVVDANPGDLIIVDNHRVAHAREAYRPRYDGTDRWLLRLVSYRTEKELDQPYQTLNNRVLSPQPVPVMTACGSGSRAHGD